MTTKTCNQCDQEKPLDAFPVDRALKTGRKGYCKECERKQRAQRKNTPPPGVTSKVCNRCGIDKDLDRFVREAVGKYGRKSICKECK